MDWQKRCSKCDRRRFVFVERGQRWCVKCAEAEEFPAIKRALIRHRYGTDPAGYTPQVLREIAGLGLMDANLLFAPAGKLSMAEAKAREASNILPTPAPERGE